MNIQKVTVVGAGIMGAGIAQVCAQEDLSVSLVDVAQETLGRGIEIIASSLQQAVSKGAISRADMQRILDSYQFSFAQKAQNTFQFLCKPLVYRRLPR
jgi:3-hydroxybutyryl-CoA dehydrogenase